MTEHQRKVVRRLSWEWTLRLVGLAGVIAEWARFGAERPFLLTVFAGMMGLPSFIPKSASPPGGTPDDE